MIAMRIKTLTMSAFGPYSEKTTLSFELLNDKGLFLITGDTGSGKTFIFDAIMFALYGKSSGSDREGAHFRSDFALPSTETFVELTFELHQAEYKIHRHPSYPRKGYKTNRTANALITYPDGKVIEGVKEVNKAVIDLLGIEFQQFRQIAMIAQGQFTKLIYASSEEREGVLRKIFNTTLYQRFEMKLKDKNKESKDRFQQQEMLMKQIVQSLDMDDDRVLTMLQYDYIDYSSLLPLLEEVLERQKQTWHIVKDKKTCLEKKLMDKRTLLEKKQWLYAQELERQKLLEQEKELMKQEDDMISKNARIMKLKDVKELEPLRSHCYQEQTKTNEIEKERDDARRNLDETKKQEEILQQEYQCLPSLIEKQNEMSKTLEQLRQQQVLLEEIHVIEKNFQTVEKEYHYVITQCQQLEENIKGYQEQCAVLEDSIKEDDHYDIKRTALVLKMQEQEKKRTALETYHELEEQQIKLEETHFDLSEHFNQSNIAYQEAMNRYFQQDTLYKKEQAGMLAYHLQDGQPCPVCGSTHHPQLASLSQQVVTVEELDQLSMMYQEKEKIKDIDYERVMQCKNDLSLIKEKKESLLRSLQLEENLEKTDFIHYLHGCIEAQKNIEKEIKHLDHQKKQWMKNKERLNDIYQKIETSQQNLVSETEKQFQLKEEVVKLKTLFDEKQKQCQWEDMEMLRRYSQSLQDEWQQAKEKIDHTQMQYDHIRQQYHVLLGRYDMLERQYQEQISQLENISSSFKEQVLKSFESMENYQQYQSDFKNLETLEQQVKSYQEICWQVKQQLTILQQHLEQQDFSGMEELSEEVASLDEQKKEVVEQEQLYFHRFKSNEKTVLRFKEVLKEYQYYEHQCQLYQDLYNVTSGQNRLRLSFERFVLTTYFDQVLHLANYRFLDLSQGRYRLLRKTDKGKGQAQQGLDLEVLDYETGSVRDVKTLSGGESFKAALALALGLSDMIQSYHGGIELNTLFIDEGFGSLDQQSLDQALRVLTQLQEHSKVIGIISHVNELKEKITTQVRVHKKENGSIVEIVCD